MIWWGTSGSVGEVWTDGGWGEPDLAVREFGVAKPTDIEVTLPAHDFHCPP